MERDWDAEQAEVDREYTEAKAASDKAHQVVSPSATLTKMTTPADLIAFGEAYERFKAAAERRTAFLHERYGLKR